MIKHAELIDDILVQTTPILDVRNCEIRNAKFAISNSLHPESYVPSFGDVRMNNGGNITVKNSEFINNLFDIVYTNTANPSLSDKCEVSDCIFKVESGFPFDETKEMCVYNYNGIQLCFKGCTFIAPTEGPMATAIKSMDGGLAILDSNGNPCSFRGFMYAVHAQAINGGLDLTPVTIKNSEFIRNYRAIYLDALIFPEISSCIFERGTDEEFASVEILNLEEQFEYFVYLNYCDAFDVEENIFCGATEFGSEYDESNPYFTDYGIIANNSGNNPNIIQRNSFSYLTRAITSLNDNLWTSTSNSGLVFQCNHFRKTFDKLIWCTRDSDWDTTEPFGASQFQGSIETSAGNYFETFNHDYEIYNSGEALTYFHTSQDLSFVPSNLYGASSVSLGEEAVTNCEYDPIPSLEITLEQIEELKENLASLIDGGNSEELTLDIIHSDYNEAIALTYELLSKSPFLSDETLKTAIDKEFDLPNALLVEILQANPWAIKDKDIRDKLDEKLLPFADFEKELIESGYGIVSAKENLISELTVLNRIVSNNLRQEVKNRMIERDFSQLITILDSINISNPSQRSIEFRYLLSDPQSGVVEINYADPANDFSTQHMNQYHNVMSQWCSSPNDFVYSPSNSLCDDKNIFGQRIRNLTNFLSSNEEHENSPILILDLEPKNSTSSSTTEKVDIFPNPNYGRMTLQSSLFESKVNIGAELFSISGQSLGRINMQGLGRSRECDLNLAPGTYVLILKDQFGNTLAKENFVIID